MENGKCLFVESNAFAGASKDDLDEIDIKIISDLDLKSSRNFTLVRMRTLSLFLALLISFGNADVKRFALPSSQAVPYVMGGVPITFSGLSLDENTHLKCIINYEDGRDSTEVEPIIPFDHQSATCRLQPEINSGRIDVDLEINGAKTQEILSGIFLINPSPNNELQVDENFPESQVGFTWDSAYFAQFYPPDGSFLLEAHIYISEGGLPTFIDSSVVFVVGANAGAATVTVSDSNVGKIFAFNYPYFYVMNPMGKPNITLTSELFTPSLGKNEGLAREICATWDLNSTGPPEPISPCPPCLCKVNLDPNFIQTEYVPQIVKLADGKLEGHVLYYERVPNEAGHAQTCSYNIATEALATSSPAQAGWVHQISKFNSYVDNYFADIWPYIVCCMQSNSAEFCSRFHAKRPISTGHDYPGADDPCQGTGDPHMITFEGIKYDFMGWGEFWLIKGPSNFGVQGRMAPLTEGQRVSYYRAVAMRDGNTTVQIQHFGGALQILVDGIDFKIQNQPFTLPFGSVSISVNGAQVEVRLRTGFTIKVQSYPASDHFNLYGSGARSNRGKGFKGIFGNFDSDPENDLTSQDGYVIPPTPENLRNLSLIHNLFGLTWMTNEEESFFTYEEGKSWDDYANRDFGPIMEYPDPSTMPEEVRRICGNSLACYYEYEGTGRMEDAEDTVDAENEFDDLKEEIERKIPLCEDPEPIENGRVDVGGYMNGSVATYICGDEYDVSGEDEIMCIAAEDGETAEWEGTKPVCIWTCTRCLEDVEYQLSHDPADCTKFFLCSNGERFPLECPEGEVFGREELACGRDVECEAGC